MRLAPLVFKAACVLTASIAMAGPRNEGHSSKPAPTLPTVQTGGTPGLSAPVTALPASGITALPSAGAALPALTDPVPPASQHISNIDQRGFILAGPEAPAAARRIPNAPVAANGSLAPVSAGAALKGSAAAVAGQRPNGKPSVDPDAELNKLYQGSKSRPGTSPAVAGKTTPLSGQLVNKIALAKKLSVSSPESVPELYLEALRFAQNKMGTPELETNINVNAVISSARGIAAASLNALVERAYQTANSVSRAGLKKQLDAFDQWDELLGSQGHPLIANLADLKKDIESGGRTTAGHGVRIIANKSDAERFIASLPGTPVRALPQLKSSPEKLTWLPDVSVRTLGTTDDSAP